MYGGSLNTSMAGNSYIPFTYHLFLPSTQEHYYGVRYKKGCHPSELWTTYFSSSKIVNARIKQYGKDAFEYEIRKTFATREDALLWESEVLRRLSVNTKKHWLNISQNSPLYTTPTELYERWKNKIRMTMNTDVMKNYLRIKAYEQFNDPIKRESHRQGRLGNKNPAFGTIWINDGQHQKRINPTKLTKFITDGWTKGKLGLRDSSGRFIRPGQILSPMCVDPTTKRFLKQGDK